MDTLGTQPFSFFIESLSSFGGYCIWSVFLRLSLEMCVFFQNSGSTVETLLFKYVYDQHFLVLNWISFTICMNVV